MPKKIILKEEGLNGADAPSGFKFLGLNNNELSMKTGPVITPIGGSGSNGDSIYTTNGTITTPNMATPRIVTIPNDRTLRFDMGDDRSKFILDVDSGTNEMIMDIGGLEINTGASSDIFVSTENGEGIKYDSDYSATFVDRSLIDKQYVDSAPLRGNDKYFIRGDEGNWTFDSKDYTALLWTATFSANREIQIDNFDRFRRLKVFIVNNNSSDRDITFKLREGTAVGYTNASIITDGGDVVDTVTVKGNKGLSIELFAFYESSGPTYVPFGDVIGKA